MLDHLTSELFADMIPCMFDRVAIYLMHDHLTSELFTDMIPCMFDSYLLDACSLDF